MKIAITREVSPSIGKCELTHMPRHEIDIDLAGSQHAQYENVLREMGCEIRRLAAEPDLPDSVFVEDVAIVLKEIAVITRPGAVSRRAETKSVGEALEEYRKLFTMAAPGQLDGGDVLLTGKTIYVGLSGRTNESGIRQLSEFTLPYGYKTVPVPVTGCLHLKSAVSLVGEGMLLINRSWVDPKHFDVKEFIDIDQAEPYAANALLVEDEVMYPASFPNTLQLLKQRGIKLKVVDVSELQKAEGALTCCSLLFER